MPSRAMYDRIGVAYRTRRRPDARIAAAVAAAVGPASPVINVGAGTGSYEPPQTLAAVDVSLVMLAQRPRNTAPAVRACATRLPFPDGTFATSLAILTLHHWPDLEAGLAEMRRVARDRVVVMTWDPQHDGFWLTRDYFPEVATIDRDNFPSLDRLRAALGEASIQRLPVPHDCADGFLGAYWRRPHAYLDAGIRAGMSTFAKVPDLGPGLTALREDLDSGAWQERNELLTTQPDLDVGYRLVVGSAP